MGFRSRLAALIAPGQKLTPEQWFDSFGGGLRTATGLTVSQTSAMQSSAVMACVSILSEDVAKLPWHVMRRKGDGGKAIAKDHPIERLLQRPNNWQSAFEYKEQMMAALLLRGNAYSPIIRDRFGADPVALVPVNPDRVWLYEAQDGSLFYNVARQRPHEMAVLKSLPLLVPYDDMLHVRWLSMNSLWGVSRISLAREAMALSLAQQEHAARFAGNGAALGGFLSTAGKLSKETRETLKQSWRDNYEGPGNAGKTAVLEEGLKFEKLGLDSVDSEFIAARQFQVEEIARIFRIPLHKLGVQGAALGGDMSQLDQDYMNNTLLSYIERWESKLNDTFGLDGVDEFVEFDVSRFLRADEGRRMNTYRIGIMSSVLTPNDARTKEDKPRDPKGDTLLQPNNMVPLGTKPTAPTAPKPGGQTPGQSGAPSDGSDGDAAKDPAAEDAKALDLSADLKD